ncbi:MAG TPA: GDSL-type esterase/lipase family protein [Thermoanaerobaculia bacterium]|jgi:lysophospholipase L1-like esterase|nr:GDSL-type esterase/lipase family protein [Thermoanaerobaculia bacterium]
MRRLLTALLLLLVTSALVLLLGTRRDVTAGPPLHDGVRRVVVLGDSVARGAGDEKGLGLPGWLNHDLQAQAASIVSTLNLGIDGGRTFNVARLLRDPRIQSSIAQADLVVMSVGGNDLYGDSSARLLSKVWPWVQRERTLSSVESLVANIRQINPAARIYVLGLYNPYQTSNVGRWIDVQVNLWDGALIQRLSEMRGVTVIRIADVLARSDRLSPIDHFHPGTLGYAAIARRIADTF